MSLAFESIAPGNRFEFHPHSVLDGNHGSCLEYKSRPGRAYLVNGRRIIAVHQHMPTPLAHSHHEQLDLEIGGRLPLCENLQDPLLGILVLRRRSLRTFEPADHVFTRYSPFLSCCRTIRSAPMDFLSWKGFNGVCEQLISAGRHTWAPSRRNAFSRVKSRGIFLMRNPIGMSVISVPDHQR